MSKEGTIGFGDYLLARLVELGAATIFGVPGDYNMGFLDLIEDHKDLHWAGNCNELNAAYAADGYARTARRTANSSSRPGRGKIAAVVTTFGVGELSALNGVAGSFAERLPVVHIVGVPSTSDQGNHSLLHHTLGDGRFDAFEEMSKKISIAVVKLEDFKDDPIGAVKSLDRALTIGFREARPIYVSLPTDLVKFAVPSKGLDTPLDTAVADNDKKAEEACLRDVLARINAAKDPVIIVDACAIRHDVLQETDDLINSSGFAVYTTPMGKGAVDEEHAQFGGVYVGSNTSPAIKERVESADLLIQVGSLLSDFNTANFSYRTPKSETIQFHSDRVNIGYATYDGMGMKNFLPKVSAQLKSHREARISLTKARMTTTSNKVPTREEEIKDGASSDLNPETITQSYLWPRMGQFVKEYDQLIAETGTSSFGSLAIKLPSCSIPSFHSQVLWGSIGWSVGACLGIAMAAREEKLGRVMLFVGDGSFQLTAQEVSTMVREGLNPILFVLSNDGYEIERQIHGPERRYNNVARWNFEAFCKTFEDVNKTDDVTIGGLKKDDSSVAFKASHKADNTAASKVDYFAVKTRSDMDKLFADESFANSSSLRFVEIYLNRGDAPKALLGQTSITSKANAY
ncbi:hypothetical protein CBS101457_006083 [Exobasidium rhododendri]|nr:hypothetical protein CBS101457_006083 [Exobasidium rhododendri]